MQLRNWQRLRTEGVSENYRCFYVTTYRSDYTDDRFRPAPIIPQCTSYTRAPRPIIQYTRKLDEKDNPLMGQLLADAYVTLTARDYKPFQWKYSGETIGRVIPSTALNSGYVRELKTTIPSTEEIRKVLAKPVSKEDLCSCQFKIPVLHQLKKSKDPIAKGRCYAGPAYMSTESHSCFSKPDYQQEELTRTLYLKDIGPKECSGSCKAHNTPNPITSEISGMPHITTSSTEQCVPVTLSDFKWAPKKRYFPKVAPSSTRRSGFTLSVSTDSPYLGKIQTEHGVCLPRGDKLSISKMNTTSTQTDSYPWPKEEVVCSPQRHLGRGQAFSTGFIIGNTPRGFPGDWSTYTEPWTTTTLENFKDYEISKTKDLNDLIIPLREPPSVTRQYELHAFKTQPMSVCR